MNIGEAVVSALVPECQAFVVDAKLVHQCGMEIVHRHLVFDDRVAEIVGLTMDQARLKTSSGDECGEAVGMMVTPVRFFYLPVLAERCPSEFPTPNDNCVLEESALLEIKNQCRTGLIGFAAALWEVVGEVEMMIPARVKKLNETDVPLGKAASHQAVESERSGFASVFTVEFVGRFRFAGKVGQAGNRALHAKRHLVLRDARFHRWVVAAGELLSI